MGIKQNVYGFEICIGVDQQNPKANNSEGLRS